jgi:hypothetical protein
MGRCNPVGLRLKVASQWPSTLSHPLLSAYLMHLFQHHSPTPPSIRSSTSGGVWVNMTVLEDPKAPLPLAAHPKVQDPLLDWTGGGVQDREAVRTSYGKVEGRLFTMARQHHHFRDVFAGRAPAFLEREEATYAQLVSLYARQPVSLRLNVIRNPLLSAQVCADVVGKSLGRGANLARVHKSLLASL